VKARNGIARACGTVSSALCPSNNGKESQAALVKLNQALDSLRASQAAGANVGTLIALIEQVIASLH